MTAQRVKVGSIPFTMKRGTKMNSFKVLRRLQPLYCTVLAIALVLPQSLEAAETGTAQSDEAQYNEASRH